MIVFIGLGLIGGSMLKALRGFEGLRAVCVDRDAATRAAILADGMADEVYADVQDAPLEQAKLVVLCLHPALCVQFVREQGARLRPGAVLTDVCGVKRELFEAARTYLAPGVTFVGGHPMAGKEKADIRTRRLRCFAARIISS